ncbi:flagellar basal-body MS-ring/collar protein FliF [Zhongshania sp.]|jgi:flagellar M-ring protein FliF|uniref:flagellar basal-body MS-ring/collar protein FliF n=1 Tax=Zhongshania sp. TaxID=1971902 RepID=UPI001B6C3E33|nr:flagellar basal-body MS-ring/collar protein FliF [Zhongshania sp.]MBQ0797222.1 flagellar M-ring protein FliF [Zhongshania sp.]|tara:strand:+ start:2908 stop:4542 length:1635 start_codon:yes stop_codon:yes gene_type:complete
MAEAKGNMPANLLAQMAGNDVLRQLLILVGIAASVAVGVAAVMWSQGSDYRTLYANVEPQRAAGVVDALNAAGIPYKIQDNTGSIMVPSTQLHDARIKLAGQGVMRDGSGMAMLEQEQGFGVSEFMQSKKFHYALEQELARTIESMHQVRKARVHLAIPKQSVFVRDRKAASASIMLDVFPGSVIDKQNVAAIVNLVASSITGLSPEQVTVVDQQGQQLSYQGEKDDLGLSSRQFTYRQRIEEAYQQNIQELLGPLADAGQVRVKVAADIDFSSAEESRETWNPESKVVRSEQINEQMDGSNVNANASGIPGALSNQPPSSGGVEEAAKADTGNRSIVRNYEIERILNHSSTPTGMVRRLSVAVVVANHQRTNDEGETVTVEVSPTELEKLNLLVRDAIGFDAARGDRVTVVSADFRPVETMEMDMTAPGFWEQPWFANLIKQSLIGVGVLFIIFAILRPGMRTLMQAQVSGAHSAQRSIGNGGDGSLSGEVLHPAIAALGAPPIAGRMGFEDKMTEVRSVVDENPQRVAQVMKKWVAEENGKS